MSLSEELQRLGAALRQGDPQPATAMPPAGAAADAVVVIPAGGFGYRMRGALEGEGALTQKALLPLPTGETLIGRLVRQYAAAGFREFVALVNHGGAEVEAHLDGGRPWGVEVRCSFDPEPTGSGRTGAIRHAINLGLLPADRVAVVHNADCPVIHYPGSFPQDLLAYHGSVARERGAVATVVAVDGYRYPYTGMAIREGRVTSIEMYPFIPVPAHTGISVLEPAALAEIAAQHPPSRKNFEQDFFPRWATEERLAALVIGADQWIAVDDRKAYRQLTQALEAGAD